MPRGGARNRSGPPKDPNSARSERLGVTFRALPAEGYSGDVPKWPVPGPGKGAEDTAKVLDRRARALWASVWRTPQAVAWAEEPWRWQIIAEMCLVEAVVQLEPAVAAPIAQLHRFRDQLGLTPAGLRENGWVIGPVEAAEEAAVPVRRVSARDRLKVVGDERAGS